MSMRQRDAAARATENPTQHEVRLAAPMRQTVAAARATETPVQHDTRLAAKRQILGPSKRMRNIVYPRALM